MPLAPQIVITPITVTSSGMTTSSVDGVYSLNTASPAFKTVAADATGAWSAVLGKNTIFYATTAPAGSHTEGDTWFDTDNGYKIHKWDGTQWVATQFGSAAFGAGSVDLAALASGAVDATKLVDGAVVQSKVAAGAIGANQIAANAIVAGKIAANAITSENIQAGQITSSLIAAGAITADKIAAGAISASMITTGTMDAARISGGIISGVVIDTSGGIKTAGIMEAPTVKATSTLLTPAISNSGGVDIGTNVTLFGSVLPYSITSATGTNYLVRDANGYMRIGASTSSSARYKNSITPIGDVPDTDPQALLDVDVVAFKYNDDFLQPDDPRYGAFVPGIIAEQLDQVYPIAVNYGSEADGFPVESYDPMYLIPGMLALIQQQAKTIADLQSRVEALEARP